MAECSRVALIVDDDRSACMIAASHLRHAGWTVTTADGPDGAFSAADQTRFSLLITDLQLESRLDGIAVFRALRERQPFLRGILLSAHVDYGIILQVIETGFDDCLMKPASSAQLASAAEASCSIFNRWTSRITDLRQLRR